MCVLTMHTELHFIQQSINAGAIGYVTKYSAADELVRALLAVSEIEPYFLICGARRWPRTNGTRCRIPGAHCAMLGRQRDDPQEGVTQPLTPKRSLSRKGQALTALSNLLSRFSGNRCSVIMELKRHGLLRQCFAEMGLPAHEELNSPWE